MRATTHDAAPRLLRTCRCAMVSRAAEPARRSVGVCGRRATASWDMITSAIRARPPARGHNQLTCGSGDRADVLRGSWTWPCPYETQFFTRMVPKILHDVCCSNISHCNARGNLWARWWSILVLPVQRVSSRGIRRERQSALFEGYAPSVLHKENE